jgi:hypothetical protein
MGLRSLQKQKVACLLFASGYAEDFNQAKAIVAVEATGMLTGSN